jgi:hypothetical protein
MSLHETKKDIALLTIVKNENYFLKKWLSYYGQYFKNNDIYVIDHETSDGSTKNLDVNLTYITNNNKISTKWLCEVVEEYHEKLLEKYNAVMYTDVDEFIFTKDGSNLKEYINKKISDGTNCFISTGYNLFHWKQKEPNPIDYYKPLFAQRQFVKPESCYNKPFLFNYVPRFNLGFHTAQNEQPYNQKQRNDPNLIMIHTKLYDQQESVKRYLERYKNSINEDTAGQDQGWILNGQVDKFLWHHFPDKNEPYDPRFASAIELDKLLSNHDYKNII